MWQEQDWYGDIMPRFDRNQSSLIEKLIRENTKSPKIGIVQQVFEHAAPEDDSNFEVNLLLNGGTTELNRVPVLTPSSGTIAPPKNGDKMLVIFADGDSERPISIGTSWSSTDRPPLGRAGIYRNQFESGSSPAGDGNLNITGYTSYDGDVASEDKRELEPEETFVQIAKHTDVENVDPSTAGDLPAKVEMYDSPKDGEAWISVEINKVGGSDSTATWGMKFNIATGEFKLVDPEGHGITSNGSGKFEWQYKELDFVEKTSGGDLSI